MISETPDTGCARKFCPAPGWVGMDCATYWWRERESRENTVGPAWHRDCVKYQNELLALMLAGS